MNFAVIGSGGREHAICFKLKQSKQVKNLYCIPGNAGTIKNKDNKILSNGGRVLNATVVAKTLKEARNKAIKILDSLDWDNKYFRKDIGYKVID